MNNEQIRNKPFNKRAAQIEAGIMLLKKQGRPLEELARLIQTEKAQVEQRQQSDLAKQDH